MLHEKNDEDVKEFSLYLQERQNRDEVSNNIFESPMDGEQHRCDTNEEVVQILKKDDVFLSEFSLTGKEHHIPEKGTNQLDSIDLRLLLDKVNLSDGGEDSHLSSLDD